MQQVIKQGGDFRGLCSEQRFHARPRSLPLNKTKKLFCKLFQMRLKNTVIKFNARGKRTRGCWYVVLPVLPLFSLISRFNLFSAGDLFAVGFSGVSMKKVSFSGNHLNWSCHPLHTRSSYLLALFKSSRYVQQCNDYWNRNLRFVAAKTHSRFQFF